MVGSFPRKLFVNLPVRDLAQSMAFFSALGFTFNPRLTDGRGACMTIGPDAFVLLLAEPFFRRFTPREPCDTRHYTEGLFAVSCSSRDEVDDMVRKAVARGGAYALEPQDHDFLYGWSFYDLDGHHWDVLWMKG